MQTVIDDADNSARPRHYSFSTTESLLSFLQQQDYAQAAHIVIMSNGGFEGLHGHLLEQLDSEAEQ